MGVTWGWDGGGTKTEILCLDERGVEQAREVFGPLNLNGSSKEQIIMVVGEALRFMAAGPGGLSACEGLVIGTAGLSNAAAVHLLEYTVREAGYTGPLALMGDQEAALAGAIEGPGAVLIAGTGSICYGRNTAKARIRVGGYGHLIDDEGGGYAIGRDILAVVVRAFDGRMEPSCLTELSFEYLGIDTISQLISWLYRPENSKKEVAALAPLLLKALEQRDAAAVQIAKKAANFLGELALVTWKKLGLSNGELALTGSILKNYPLIRQGVEQLCRERYPAMRCIAPRGSSAYGAALLAKEKSLLSSL